MQIKTLAGEGFDEIQYFGASFAANFVAKEAPLPP